MTDESMLDYSSVSTVQVPTNPHEIALQSLCKQLLKSRLFRGFYVERRYVENVKGYRDIVCLQRSEKSLDKILRDMRDKLQLFYSLQNPQIWIGITSGTLTGISIPQTAVLDTYLWVEIKDLAFGQYWFSIKSIRFRGNEIILKLKEVQPVDEEEASKWTPYITSKKSICDKANSSIHPAVSPLAGPMNAHELQPQINLDFMLLLHQWWASIQQTVYEFMAHDITKENIKGFVRFVGLLIVSLFSCAIVGVKFLGYFTLRFLFELSRLTQVLTPIICKIIDLFNKIIGGFFILLAMIWKDAVVNRNQPKQNALEYNRPIYKSIQYEMSQRRRSSSTTSYGKSFQ